MIRGQGCGVCHWNAPFKLERFVFHFRPRNVLMGIFFLFFHKLCVHLRVYKTFPGDGVASRGVKWES